VRERERERENEKESERSACEVATDGEREEKDPLE